METRLTETEQKELNKKLIAIAEETQAKYEQFLQEDKPLFPPLCPGGDIEIN